MQTRKTLALKPALDRVYAAGSFTETQQGMDGRMHDVPVVELRPILDLRPVEAGARSGGVGDVSLRHHDDVGQLQHAPNHAYCAVQQ